MKFVTELKFTQLVSEFFTIFFLLNAIFKKNLDDKPSPFLSLLEYIKYFQNLEAVLFS